MMDNKSRAVLSAWRESVEAGHRFAHFDKNYNFVNYVTDDVKDISNLASSRINEREVVDLLIDSRKDRERYEILRQAVDDCVSYLALENESCVSSVAMDILFDGMQEIADRGLNDG